MQDPYKVLGVSESSTDDEIKKAYRKLAAKYHPDLNPGDRAAELKMQEINCAYEMVKDIRSGKNPYSESRANTSGYYEEYRYGGSYNSSGYNYGRYYQNSQTSNQEDDFEDIWQPYSRNVRVVRFPFFKVLLGIMLFRLLGRILFLILF